MSMEKQRAVGTSVGKRREGKNELKFSYVKLKSRSKGNALFITGDTALVRRVVCLLFTMHDTSVRCVGMTLGW